MKAATCIDVVADIRENSTGASKAPLRRRLLWRANEREALRRGLLMFGLGRSDRVRSVMHSILKQMRHGLGDVADCCWEFVRICGLHADQKERSYAEKMHEKSKDSGVEVGAEVSLRVGQWERVEKSATSWLKRLMLLDSLGNAIRLCASKETQGAAYNAIDSSKDGTSPFEWWGRDADLALLAGVYKHGFGNYEALHSDPQFAGAFKPSLQRDNIRMFSEAGNMEQSFEFGDPHYKKVSVSEDQLHSRDDLENTDMRNDFEGLNIAHVHFRDLSFDVFIIQLNVVVPIQQFNSTEYFNAIDYPNSTGYSSSARYLNSVSKDFCNYPVSKCCLGRSRPLADLLNHSPHYLKIQRMLRVYKNSKPLPTFSSLEFSVVSSTCPSPTTMGPETLSTITPRPETNAP
eukprot:Gb_21545 [translate_table: standard]